MILNMESGDSSILLILFLMMGMPMIGCGIGLPLILKYGPMGSMKRSGFSVVSKHEEHSSYVYEVPSKCSNCKANLNAEIIDWVGPLSIQCPYCEATQKTEKNKVYIHHFFFLCFLPDN